jgi:hypothetical protein
MWKGRRIASALIHPFGSRLGSGVSEAPRAGTANPITPHDLLRSGLRRWMWPRNPLDHATALVAFGEWARHRLRPGSEGLPQVMQATTGDHLGAPFTSEAPSGARGAGGSAEPASRGRR